MSVKSVSYIGILHTSYVDCGTCFLSIYCMSDCHARGRAGTGTRAQLPGGAAFSMDGALNLQGRNESIRINTAILDFYSNARQNSEKKRPSDSLLFFASLPTYA